MSRLKVKAKRESERAFFMLSGMISSGACATLAQETANAPKHCEFDWDEVSLASSDGLREWVQFFSEFRQGRDIMFSRLRPALVSSFNVIPQCVAGARIASIYGAFVCLECRKESDVLLTVGPDVTLERGLVRRPPCRHCGNPDMELSLSEEEYFRII